MGGKIMDGVEEEDMEKEYFRRRFMMSRQSQTSPHEKLEVTDSRTDMLWKLFDMNSTPTGCLFIIFIHLCQMFSYSFYILNIQFTNSNKYLTFSFFFSQNVYKNSDG